jgi:hypothetical protein
MPGRRVDWHTDNCIHQQENTLMLSWLFPRPPLDLIEQTWVETRLRYLIDEIGLARLIEMPVALPTPAFFLGTCDGTRDGAQRLLARMCEHVGIDPRAITLETVEQDACHASAGHGCGCSAEPVGAGETVVRVASSELADPEMLAATLARQLASSRPRGEPLPGGMPGDQAWMSDMVAICHGLGLFVANAAVQAASPATGHGGCSPRPASCLPARMSGYALALCAHLRGQGQPEWKDHLRLDAAAAYVSGLRYLRRYAGTLLAIHTADGTALSAEARNPLRLLSSRAPSDHVAALWGLRNPACAAEAAEAVTKCLYDPRPLIREEAVKTLAYFGPHAFATIPRLVEMLEDYRYSIRAAAAVTLGMLGQEPDQVVPGLAELLADDERAVVFAAARGLAQFGPQANGVLSAALAALKIAIIRCDHSLIDALTRCLYSLEPDPTQSLLEQFGDDPEFCTQAVHLVVTSLSTHDDRDTA